MIEDYAGSDQRVARLLARIRNHLSDSSWDYEKLYNQTARFRFTFMPWRIGLYGEDVIGFDKNQSTAEAIVENHDQISGDDWFEEAPSNEWVALIAMSHLVDGLASRRLIESTIARGQPDEIRELELSNVTVANHVAEMCLETAEILTVADCFMRERAVRRAKAKRGASKRHERSYEAIDGFVEFYQGNTAISRNEAARRYYRASLADLDPPVYRNEEQAVRSLTAALRKKIGLKDQE
ncbi:MAG: hypothetical protein AAFQ62_10295 [Pseudomonadota bacterium]